MQTIKNCIILLLVLCLWSVNAQNQDSISSNQINYKLELLNNSKKNIEDQERKFLKKEVENINLRLNKKEISKEEAEKLKIKAAEKRAANIEDRLTIINSEIALLKRNEGGSFVSINENGFLFTEYGSRPKKYDKRTNFDLVAAFGYNNAIIKGESFGDTYGNWKSIFVELGVSWKTRLLEESNFVRIKYGLSFQWNVLGINDNKYLVKNGNITSLESFPLELKRSNLTTTNLVFPIHFEFGPSKKNEKKEYFRYSIRKKFKFAIGGYAGFNIGTSQYLQYKEDGETVKQTIRRGYNTSDFIYGLSSYIGIGNTSLYLKYDLSPVFKNQAVDQKNISIGIRSDL